MLWTAALLLWHCLRTAWRTVAFAVRVATFVLSLPFRAVGLAYKIFLVASLCCLKLLDCYWRVLVLERSMLFSWIMYELVLSISLLIGLKAAHALVWFSKRALRACCLSQESQAWQAALTPVQPGKGELCPICLEPFIQPRLQLVQVQQQQRAPWSTCLPAAGPGGGLQREDCQRRSISTTGAQLRQPLTPCSPVDAGALWPTSRHGGVEEDVMPTSFPTEHAAPSSSACGLPCGHVFCRPCVTRWLGQHRPTCPLCRCNVLPDSIPSPWSQWLLHSSATQQARARWQPLLRSCHVLWSLLLAVALLGPFVYGWYHTLRFVGRRVGVYHSVTSQAAWLDLILSLGLFMKVLHRRRSMEPRGAARV